MPPTCWREPSPAARARARASWSIWPAAGNCGSRLDEASEEFSKVLGQIKAAVTDSPGLTARLESSTNLWTLYRESMEMRDPAEFPHVARKVFRISEDLLNRTDAMVELCVGLPEVNDGPALVGGAAGSPVVAISPLIAWTTMS